MELEVEKDRGGLRRAGDSDSGLGLAQHGTWLSSSALPSSLAEWLPLRLRDLGGSAVSAPDADPASSARQLTGTSSGDAAGAATADEAYLFNRRQSTPLSKSSKLLSGDHQKRWNSVSAPSPDWSTALSDNAVNQSGLKDALADSERRREVLLEKLKEAQETLRVQSARLAKVETAYHNATFEAEELKHKEVVMRNKVADLEKQSRNQAKQRSDEVGIQAALHNQIQEMEANFQKFVSDYQLLEVDHGRRRELVEQLTTTIELVEDENRKLHKCQSELTNDVRQMQQQLVSLTEERKTLQAQADSSKRDAAHWRQEYEDCQRCQKSSDETISELRIKMATLNHKVESLDQSHDTLHKEKLSAQHHERELTEAITDLRSKVAILNSDRERANHERIEMQHKIEAFTLSKADTDKALEILRSQLTTATTELRHKQDSLTELQERFKKLQEEENASRKVAEKLSQELTRLKEQYEHEQEERLALKRSNTRLTEDNACLEETTSKLKRGIAACKSEMECLQSAYAQERQKLDDTVDKLQATVRKMQNEAAQQEESVTELLNKLKQHEVDSARQLNQLSEECQQWRERYESAQASMQRKEDEVSIIAHKAKELQIEVTRLEAELHTKQVEFDSSIQLREELLRLQLLNKRLQLEKAENEQVVQLLQTQRDIYARSVSEHAAKAHEVQSKADRMKLMEEDIAKNSIKAEELQKQLHILLDQKEELLLKAQAAEDSFSKLEGELTQATGLNASLSARLHQLEEDNAALTAELNASRDSAIQAAEVVVVERKANAESYDTLAAEAKSHREEAAARACELSALKLDWDTLQAEKRQLEERYTAMLVSVRAHETAALAASKETLHLTSASGALEAEKSELARRCCELDAELRRAQSELAEQVGSLRAALAEARGESAAWSAECARLRAEALSAGELQRRLAEAERQWSLLKAELTATAEREAGALERFAAEKQAAVEELAAAIARAASLRSTCGDLETARSELLKEREDAGARLRALARERDALLDEAKEARRLEAELDAAQAQCDQQQADLAVQADVLAELRLVKERCESLQASLSETGELSEKELAALRDSQERALRNSEALALHVEELEAAAERDAASARAELRRRDEAIEDLEEEVKHLEQKRDRALADMRHAQEELDEALEELKKSRDSAETLLREKTSLLLEKSALQQETAELKLRMSTAEAKLLEKADSENKIGALRSQLSAAESQSTQAEAQIGRLQTELAILRRDNSAQIDELARNNSENLSDLQSSMWQLREELRQSHDIQERQEDLIATLQEEISLLRKYEQECRELREKLRVATEKERSASQDDTSAQELTRLLSVKDEELRKWRLAVSAANAELGKRDESIEKLRLKVLHLGSTENRNINTHCENDCSEAEDPQSALVLARRLEDGLRHQMLGRSSLDANPDADDIQALRHQLTKTTAELNAVVAAKRTLQSQVTELKMDVFRLQKDKETLERTSNRVQGTLASSQELLRAMTLELDMTKQRCTAAELQCDRLRSEALSARVASQQREPLHATSGRHTASELRQSPVMGPLTTSSSDQIGLPRSSAVDAPSFVASDQAQDKHVQERVTSAAERDDVAAVSPDQRASFAGSGGPALTRGQTLRIFKQLKKGKRSRAASAANHKTPRLVISEAYGGGGSEGAGRRRRDSFDARGADDEGNLSDGDEVDVLKDNIVNNSGRVEWRGDPRASIKQFSSSYDLSSISDEDDDYEEEKDEDVNAAGGRAMSMPDLAGVVQTPARDDRISSYQASSGGNGERDARKQDSPRNGSPISVRSPRSDWRKKFADVYKEENGSMM